jgi:hypothetical protein
MNNKLLIILFAFFIGCGFIFAKPMIVSAHQPKIIKNQNLIIVQNPEVSQAFYSQLKSAPQIYQIIQDKPFALYVNLLLPQLPSVNKNLSAEIYQGSVAKENLITTLDGPSAEWTKMYEPFGGDNYFQGPEYKKQVDPGTYLIKVFNPNNQGKYVIAIGEKEEFPLKEMVRTIKVLPTLKKDFFERSPLTAFFNYTGIFLLVIIIILAGIITLAIWLGKKFIKKKKGEKNFRS